MWKYRLAGKYIKLINPGKQLGFLRAILQILAMFSHGSAKTKIRKEK